MGTGEATPPWPAPWPWTPLFLYPSFHFPVLLLPLLPLLRPPRLREREFQLRPRSGLRLGLRPRLVPNQKQGEACFSIGRACGRPGATEKVLESADSKSGT